MTNLDIDDTNKIVQSFRSNTNSLLDFCGWLANVFRVTPTWAQTIFSMAVTTRTVDIAITTNWDFVLENQIQWLCEMSAQKEMFITDQELTRYPKAPYSYGGDPHDYYIIGSHKANLKVVFADSDLKDIDQTEDVIIFKIHGSPFYLYCPQCASSIRWKEIPNGILFREAWCSLHNREQLYPQITLPGESIDAAHPRVYEYLQQKMEECEIVLCVGYSGRDAYLKQLLERHPNTYVYTPTPGRWDTKRVKWIKGTATDLAKGLSAFLPYRVSP